ncbi:exodeoxyribonuclease VII large subunit [Aquabacterium olei]|uniref:Exodeoxyribonuclease 7 large subunit n=1 Tax=Aquabacterium olei TaxID=1296669 RepID=A0A2U8FR36_9BURK|nr:exodeoxyribonuclease VII large subunit [Aquabacterium olei]AWI53541.1 exodeoxyribonuclease VII large subunit [Aquabacterium olei]
MQGGLERGERPLARVWGVGALVQAIGDTLAARFSPCVVRGEISGFTRAASGHGYFTLKDEHGGASLRCAMFRRALSQVEFAPGEGMLVEARGTLAVYEARGELQLIVEALRPAGEGALYEQFLRLKARLEAEGVFDPTRKRPLPAFPVRIGVVTSLAAAALHDVLTALQRRAPHVEVVLAPASVQGAEAPPQLVDALASLAALHRQGTKLDAVVLCRGGGSLEDLWAFNDERVVRAVAACPVPVVCGVGHETDVTLCDFAADLRAPTPTAAAELVARDRAAALAALEGLAALLHHRVRRRLDGHAQRLDRAAARLARPGVALHEAHRGLALLSHRLAAAGERRTQRARQTLPTLAHRLARAMARGTERAEHTLSAAEGRLEALNPRRVLERGFAWLSDDAGHPLASVAEVAVGATVRGVLADGVLQLHVNGVEAAPSEAGTHKSRPALGE